MAEEKNEEKEESQEESEKPDSSEGEDSEDKELPDWFESDDPLEEAKRWKGIAERNKTKLEKAQESLSEDSEEKPDKEDKELDLAKKAYLRAEGVEREDFDLVEEYMQNTGKDVDEILGSKFFQQELEERQNQRKAEDGAPSGKNRSGESPKDDVDYWIEKDELPDDKELRDKVIDEKKKRSEQGGPGKFYNS